MASITPPTPMSLEEVLHVFLLSFEAAADAIPPLNVAYAVPCRSSKVSLPIWQIWTIDQLHRPPQDPLRVPFQRPLLAEALARKDMCDWFCWLLEEELREKVKELFGGEVRWLQFWPRINFLLACRGASHQLDLPMHSVLHIVTRYGQKMVMDGTLRQYLWAKPTWLQTEQQFVAKRLDTSKETSWAWAKDRVRAETGNAASEVDGGYWAIAHEMMTELLAELDWEELSGMEGSERVERVKKMAGDKFADAYDESLRRYYARP